MGEKLGAGAYAESLGNCCADAPEHVQTPTSTTSAATFARAKRRFNPGVARTHYIQVPSLLDVSVTILGVNHFEEMKKRKYE
ncbi:hypothetical protein RX327_01285 [Bradyrhizobium sp. BEA-2-5]|uniref:hypothetical protein n=1 Tax=Bradyrhizobium TaxID=374 RepID=UPI001FCE2839|nr:MULTISPECIES: hypothetical protein [Bradyrhizobium]WOH81881.1 hypothetical protein RX327_01285 [Bradyrhizobium sp. BEA-2-5]